MIKNITILLFGFLSIANSSMAFAASEDVRVCNTCVSDSSWYSFAKSNSKFMKTIEFHGYNPNTDTLKKFIVTNRQIIQPNGEPIFSTTAGMYNADSNLRHNVTNFIAQREAIGSQVLSSMSRTLDMRDFYVRVPEEIAKSPWDLVGRSYSANELSNFLDPSNRNSFWYDDLGDSFAAEMLSYFILAGNVGLTEILGLGILEFDKISVVFSSGAVMTFKYSFNGEHVFDLVFQAKYPILDSDGNVVASNASELLNARDFSGDYQFDAHGNGIDRSAFESVLTRSNWVIVEKGSYSDGAVLRCYAVYVSDVYSGMSCVKL
ncbi:hypothetical protein REH81_14120 [Vibrio rotiferianus]|uniref:hypothetical protein n=1 Tax=Vibrio sp. WZ-1 TaxID=3454501 RepID=UPI002F4847A5